MFSRRETNRLLAQGRFYSSGEQAEPPPRCVNASSQDERCEDPLLYLNGLGCDHVYVARKGPLCVWSRRVRACSVLAVSVSHPTGDDASLATRSEAGEERYCRGFLRIPSQIFLSQLHAHCVCIVMHSSIRNEMRKRHKNGSTQKIHFMIWSVPHVEGHADQLCLPST